MYKPSPSRIHPFRVDPFFFVYPLVNKKDFFEKTLFTEGGGFLYAGILVGQEHLDTLLQAFPHLP